MHFRSVSTEAKDFSFAAENIEKAALSPRLRHALITRLIGRQIMNRTKRAELCEKFLDDKERSVEEHPRRIQVRSKVLGGIRRAPLLRRKVLGKILDARRSMKKELAKGEATNLPQKYQEVVDTRSSDDAGATFLAPKALNSLESANSLEEF